MSNDGILTIFGFGVQASENGYAERRVACYYD